MIFLLCMFLKTSLLNAFNLMSMLIPMYNTSWELLSSISLDSSLYNLDAVVPSLVHEYVVMYLANQRQSNAHTKTRSEITASWRKLYRQKGTGSARVWDAASPIRRKWWTVFGPRNEKNYTKNMSRKMKIRALQSALILKISQWKAMILDWYESTWKTKDSFSVISKLPLRSSMLIVLPDNDERAFRSMSNINRLNVTYSDVVNSYDLVSNTNVVFVWDSFERLTNRVK